MADKFEQFFTDTLNKILLEHVKELKNQSEIDEFYEKYEKADFSELLSEMINDTSKQLIANAKSVMYENTLLFRCEEAEIVARINQKWFKAFTASETMYMMVLEAVKDYSDYVNQIDDKEREKFIYKYTALKYIHGRGLQQFLEIITLMKNGFADGAYSRWRSLYELNI